MYQQKPFLLVMVLFLGLVSKCFGQIVATPSTGCSPLSVSFSGPAGATNVHWNLGTGVGTSTLVNPNPIYTGAGNYNITYTALVNGSPVTYNFQLVVNAGPSGSFSYVLPGSRCLPMTVNFSGSGGSPGSTFNWAFGDLSSNLGTTGSVSHVYTNPGSFIPLMTVVDAVTGCTAVAKSGTINVSSPPTPIISSSNGFIGCVPPFTTNISGNSSISGSPLSGTLASFAWQFNTGSPASSGLPAPGVVSFGSGQHTITLTVTDNNSCSNSATAMVTSLSSSITASIQQTVCYNDFITASVTATSDMTHWKFSGSTGITTRSVTPNTADTLGMIYFAGTPGLISYTASINPGGVCPSVAHTGTFFVEKITPSLVLPSGVISTCQSPFLFNLHSGSTSNTSCSLICQWQALVSPLRNTDVINPGGPISIAGSVSPTFTMSQGSQNPYTRFKIFSPLFKLLITSSCSGCQAEITPVSGIVNMLAPTASFNKSLSQGCSPLTVTFRDTSRSDYSAITNYTFYMGTTPQQSVTGTNTIFPLSFTYTTPGTYYPYMKIKTLAGCDDISYFDTIQVVNPPTVSGSILTTSACAGNNVTINLNGAITSTIPTSNQIDHWHVETDNKFFSGCVTNPNPSFPFTHVGTHTIGVMASQRGCKSSTVIPQSITIKGPLGKLRYTTTCVGNKKEVKFDVYLQDVETATLSFGDNTNVTFPGSTGSTLSYSTTHTYSTTGNFTAGLATKNSLNPSCSVKTYTTQVKIRDPHPSILFNGQPLPAPPSSLGCNKMRYAFSASTDPDVLVGCGTGYVWDLKGPGFTMPTVEHPDGLFPTPYMPNTPTVFNLLENDTFRAVGIYTIGLKVRDENDCVYSQSIPFRVGNAEPSFTFNANPVCLSAGSVQVINNTQANQSGTDAITEYTFSFGNNPPGVMTSTNPIFNPVYSYPFAAPPSQTFNVMCIAKNNVGCTDTAYRVLKVNNPLPNLTPSNYFPCVAKSQATNVTFSAIQGYATYSLNFGDPPGISPWQNLTSFNNVSHSYNTPGSYVTTLSIIDSGSCTATETKTITVYGQPTANIVFKDNQNRFCLPGIPTMISTSSINVTPITNHMWAMSGQQALGTATLTNIIANTGIYTVNLTVSIHGMCASMDTAVIFVSDPKAKMTIDKRMFCLGDTIKVSIKDSSEVYAWKWFFGDNVPQKEIVAKSLIAQLTRTLSYPYIVYPDNGTQGRATVSLLYYAPGPTCLRTDTANINVITLEGSFSQTENIYKHCLDIADTFTGQTANPYNLSLQYDWTFPGGVTATGPSATHNFVSPGVHPVKMQVYNPEYGCKLATTKNMTIFPLPSGSFSVKDTTCPDEVFVISGNGQGGIPGSITGTLLPLPPSDTLKIMPDNTFTASAHASVTTIYTLNLKDNNGCVSKDITRRLYVQQPATPVTWDTTVIIGEPVPLNTYAGFGFTYTWTPVVTDLNCSNCLIHNPISTSTVNVTYSVNVEDGQHCSIVMRTYKINILPKISLDVPTAFTPNGDGVNDVIYADGWGIRKLNYFKIFNRWGQLLFETNDINTGWNGHFNGTLQNMETYVYQVSAESYINETVTKSGTFKLLR